MTDGRTDGQMDGQTDGRTDGGDCNIPNAFLKKRGDNNNCKIIKGSVWPRPSFFNHHCRTFFLLTWYKPLSDDE